MEAQFAVSDLAVLCHEADRAAVKLVLRHGLPPADREDLRQDFLIESLSRIGRFDQRRGTFGAFVAVIIRHRAARISAHLRRNRGRLTTVSVDDPIVGDDNTTLLDTCSEDDGYLAWMGSSANPITVLEDRLSMDRALNTLSLEHIGLCAELLMGSLGGAEGPSRATKYRRLHEVRLQLLVAGVGARA